MLDVVDEDQLLAGLHAARQQPRRGQERRLGRPRQAATDLDLAGPEPGHRRQGMVVGDRREFRQRLGRAIERRVDLGAEQPTSGVGGREPLQTVQGRVGLGVMAGLVRRIGAQEQAVGVNSPAPPEREDHAQTHQDQGADPPDPDFAGTRRSH